MVTDLLRIEKLNDQDVVDSRLIAQELGIEHRTLYRTISDNQIELEEDFGQLFFFSRNCKKLSRGGE